MNIQTIIILAIIVLLVILAIRNLIKNGDHCVGCGNGCGSCGSSKCPHCKA